MSRDRSTRWRDARAASGVTLVALAVAWRALAPFGERFRDHLTPNLQDPLFNLYLMAWGARQLALGLPDFWNAGFFFPERDVVALSDHMIGPATATWALGVAGLGAAASYNLLLLLSYPLAALSVFALLRRAGAQREAAAIGAWAFAFAPFRWLHLEHLPVLWIPALAFAIWSWDRLLTRPGPVRAAVFVAFCALHLSGGLYLAYMIHLALAAVAVSRWRELRRALGSAKGFRALAFAATGVAGAAIATFGPYLAASARGYRRTEGDMAEWGATLASFVTPSRLNRYFFSPFDGLYRFENALFPGIAVSVAGIFFAIRFAPSWAARLRAARWPVVLAAGAVLAVTALALGDLATWTNREFVSVCGWPLRIRGYSRPALLLAGGVALALVGYGRMPTSSRRLSSRGRLRRALLLQGVAATALCLPMVAAPASRFVPGLLGIRAPSRFALFTLLWGALLLAAAASFAARRLPRRWRAPGVLAAGLVMLAPEMLPRPVEWHRIGRPEEFPAVYHELARRDLAGPVAELPFARGDLRSDLLRMWHSTLHWNPTSAGYSGYEPAVARELREAEARESAEQLVARLRTLGFVLVIDHVHERPEAGRVDRSSRLAAAIEARGGEELWRDDEDRLFVLGAKSSPHDAPATPGRESTLDAAHDGRR